MELLVEMPGAVPPPPETWLQCDACGKWRRLPSTTAAAEQPERWECSLNPEARGRGRVRVMVRGRGRGRGRVRVRVSPSPDPNPNPNLALALTRPTRRWATAP